MARTTIDIENPILEEIRALQKEEGRSMGSIVSELLADALDRRRLPRPAPPFRWISRPLKAVVDLADKEAVYSILDQRDA